jgi:hypothetical protein
MPIPPFYQGVGDYLNSEVSLDSNKNKVLSLSLLQVEGVYPNLPGEIFVYENSGTTTLGAYIGICNLDELSRLQVHNPSTPIAKFANKYVRHNIATILLGLTEDPLPYVTRATTSIRLLSAEMKLKTASSSILYIPKV